MLNLQSIASAVLDVRQSTLDRVALNPQPLPPKEHPLLNSALAKALDLGAFKPPHPDPGPLAAHPARLDTLISHAFDASSLRSRLDAVLLNPQPLPPRY